MCSVKDRRYASLRISYWYRTCSRRNVGAWRTVLYALAASVPQWVRSFLPRAYVPSKFQFPLSILSWWQCVSPRAAVHHPRPRFRLQRTRLECPACGTNGSQSVFVFRLENRFARGEAILASVILKNSFFRRTIHSGGQSNLKEDAKNSDGIKVTRGYKFAASRIFLPDCASVFIPKLSSCLEESIRRLQCLELQTADRNKSNGNREGGRLWMLVDHKRSNI